jgi:subtilase family serine protease
MNLSARATRRWSIVLTTLALFALAMVLYTPIFGDFPRTLITDPIDEHNLVALSGNTRPEATRQNDRGRVPDDYAMPHMFLQMKRSPQAESELRQYIEQLTDKKSPNYHKWLTEQEIGDKYGPTKQDLQIVKSWLESHGFTVGYIYPHGMLMDFSGTAGAVREAFHTEIHYLEVKGKAHAANMSDPKIPAALAAAVAGPASLHNFHGHPMLKRGKHRAKFTDPYDSGEYLLVPADVETIYNMNPLYRQGIYGQGQTIAVVEDSDTYGTDVATFQSTLGLSKYGGSMVTLHPEPNGLTNCADPGTPTAGDSAGDEAEANFDAEYSMAAAPGAVIQVVACPSVGTAGANFGGLVAINNMLAGRTAPNIISMSYGECEVANGATGNLAYYTTFQTAAAAGISVFGSSGDETAASCDADETDATHGIGVSGWTDTPYNVAVGGTDYYDGFQSDQFGTPETNYWATANTSTQGSALSYIPEIPWNDSCASYLLSYDFGYATTYGATGFCNSATAKNNDAYLAVSGGSGGPSGCATGAASTSEVVSGTCQGYAKPTWQQGVLGNPADGVRDIPDVSLFAAIGTWGHFYIACWSDTTNFDEADYGTAPCTLPIDVFGTLNPGAPTWSGYGGTSFSSPLMAGIQALVNQKWGKQGNPNSVYYSIATAQFNSSSAANCQSQNAPVGRRGLGSTCIFNDITQGDIDTNCRAGSVAGSCFLSGSTNGAGVMGGTSTITITSPGSNYTSTPTCTLGAAAAQQPYVSPFSVTLYAGTVAPATCTASFGSSTATGSFTIATNPAAGVTVSINSTTYSFVTGTPAAVNQVEIGSGSGSTGRSNTAKNLEAVINDVTTQCATTGCVFASQTANAAVTATVSSSTVTLTAKTVGSGGNFTLASSNTTDVTFTGGSNGASGVVTALAISAGGAGYFGTTPCSITNGGGSGATCTASVGTVAGSTYQPAYGTNPGWDMSTGLGSVNAYNLVMSTAW